MWDLWWAEWQLFSECFGFPWKFSFHRLLHTHLSFIQGWYNIPNSGRRAKWTHSRPTRRKKRYSCICIIVTLQTFVGLGHFFSFFILYTVGRTPLTGDQPVARPLPTHRTINEHKHPCLEWDSNPRSQCSRGRRQFMP
jgi:hypothetical protein